MTKNFCDHCGKEIKEDEHTATSEYINGYDYDLCTKCTFLFKKQYAIYSDRSEEELEKFILKFYKTKGERNNVMDIIRTP